MIKIKIGIEADTQAHLDIMIAGLNRALRNGSLAYYADHIQEKSHLHMDREDTDDTTKKSC